MSGNTPIRIALVGVGRIALTHLEAVLAVDSARLVALVEPREDVAKPIATQQQVPWFASHTEAALLDLCDAAIVCAPPNTHKDIAGYFLQHGKHVLCEKPLAITATDATELVDLAQKNHCQLMMASKFRYVDDVIKAKAIIETGVLGRIVLYENTFAGKVNMKDRWNAQREISGGGVLIDNGTHSADIARYLLGPIVEVQAQNGIAAQGLEVEDTARMQFRTANGVIGLIDLSWSINKETDTYINVYGTEGTLLVGWKGSRYRQDGNANWVSFGSGYQKVGALANQLANFVEAIVGQSAPLITVDDAVASVEVIEAAYKSAARDNWIEVSNSR